MTLTYRIDVMDTVRKVQKWATTASNAIDSEDGRLVEQVDKCITQQEYLKVRSSYLQGFSILCKVVQDTCWN